MVWDGENKFISQLGLKPKIWSSATLYSKKMKHTREKWFKAYFNQNISSFKNVLDFHEHYGIGDNDIDLKIDRGVLKTISITSVIKTVEGCDMFYKDFLLHDEITISFNDGYLVYE